MSAHATQKITIFQPDLAALDRALLHRDVSHGLSEFLHRLLQRKRWAQKINVPSGHRDIAVVLVFATTLKASGLEICCELHVYRAGVTITERWEVLGELQKTRLRPKESFRAIDISKVSVRGSLVRIEFQIDHPGGRTGLRTKEFDFSDGESDVRDVPNPWAESV